MVQFFEFARAALPWVTIGVFLANFFVISEMKKISDEEYEDYGALGMILGVSSGSLFSIVFGGSVAICMTMGMMIGFIVGSCMRKQEKERKE